MYSAYHLDSSLNCAIFTKDSVEISSSSLAQGGIAAVTESDDNFTFHFEDTIRAGAGMCNPDAVRIIVEEGPNEINELLKLGANFDLDSNGHLLTTREGGHGMSRILHAGGDATGLEMVRTLEKTVKNKDNITLHENSFVRRPMAHIQNKPCNYGDGRARPDIQVYNKPCHRNRRRIRALAARGRRIGKHGVYTVSSHRSLHEGKP
jgi:aspartate oxidase